MPKALTITPTSTPTPTSALALTPTLKLTLTLALTPTLVPNPNFNFSPNSNLPYLIPTPDQAVFGTGDVVGKKYEFKLTVTNFRTPPPDLNLRPDPNYRPDSTLTLTPIPIVTQPRP